MIKLILNKNIIGIQLESELKSAGIDTEVLLYENNEILLNGAKENDRALAQSILDAHIPQEISQPTAADKLAAAGLTVDELKELLGL